VMTLFWTACDETATAGHLGCDLNVILAAIGQTPVETEFPGILSLIWLRSRRNAIHRHQFGRSPIAQVYFQAPRHVIAEGLHKQATKFIPFRLLLGDDFAYFHRFRFIVRLGAVCPPSGNHLTDLSRPINDLQFIGAGQFRYFPTFLWGSEMPRLICRTQFGLLCTNIVPNSLGFKVFLLKQAKEQTYPQNCVSVDN
jgi:hypothetical protein